MLSLDILPGGEQALLTTYAHQATFLNEHLEKATRTIIANMNVPQVIINQGDQG